MSSIIKPTWETIMARPEVTGRKLGASAARIERDNNDEDEPAPTLALSIRQFCKAYNISEDFFYKLKRQGQAPRLMKVGARTLISMEAAKEWRIDRETSSATEAT
jgi:predicted DNA-binding transcriptional regulator AlpA